MCFLNSASAWGLWWLFPVMAIACIVTMLLIRRVFLAGRFLCSPRHQVALGGGGGACCGKGAPEAPVEKDDGREGDR